MGEKNTYWDELAQDMEDGNYTTDPGQTVTGEAAAAEGAAMLRAAFGTDDLEQIEVIRRGRPTLGRKAARQAGESKMLRVRVTAEMDAALVELSKQRGITKSVMVRELLAEGLGRDATGGKRAAEGKAVSHNRDRYFVVADRAYRGATARKALNGKLVEVVTREELERQGRQKLGGHTE